jgi:hypothetical protein
MPCAACHGTDHSRSSSTKCKNYKPKIRKRNLDNTKSYQVYTVKSGLNRFFCSLLNGTIKAKLKQRICDDVKIVSRLMIETSYFIAAFYKYYHDHMPEKIFDKLNVLHFTYALKGSYNCKIDDPLNFISKYINSVRNGGYYDCKLRTYVIQEACKQYTTNFNNNIISHMFNRIKKFIKLLKIEENSAKIHDVCYNFYYNNDTSTNNEITKMLDIYKLRVKLVERNPVHYLPFMYELQTLQHTKGTRTCKVVPIMRQSVKHITYTTMGLLELLSSIGEKVPSAKEFRENARIYWERYFNVSSNKMFGCCFSTDGLAVSKSMNRLEKNDIRLLPQKKRKIDIRSGGSRRPWSKNSNSYLR